jgi:hypothetical protein
MPEAGNGHAPEREAARHGRRSPAALRRSGRGERACARALQREGSGARRGQVWCALTAECPKMPGRAERRAVGGGVLIGQDVSN